MSQHKSNFFEYLSGVMCAVKSSFEDLVHRQRHDISTGQIYVSYDSAVAGATIDLGLFVSCSGLSSRIAKLRPKALGESGVGGELLRLFPH
eukprot:9047663-Karenia_brevis.AAC.1